MLLGLYIIHVSINVGKSSKQYSGSEIITDGWDAWQGDIYICFLGGFIVDYFEEYSSTLIPECHG